MVTRNRVANYMGNYRFRFSRYMNALFVSVGLDYEMMVWYPLSKEISDNFKYDFAFRNILIGAFSFLFIIGVYLIYEEDSHQGKRLE